MVYPQPGKTSITVAKAVKQHIYFFPPEVFSITSSATEAGPSSLGFFVRAGWALISLKFRACLVISLPGVFVRTEERQTKGSLHR